MTNSQNISVRGQAVQHRLFGVHLHGQNVYHELSAQELGRDTLQHLLEGKNAHGEDDDIQIVREEIRGLELRIKFGPCTSTYAINRYVYNIKTDERHLISLSLHSSDGVGGETR